MRFLRSVAILLVFFTPLQALADPSKGLREFGYRYLQQLPAEGNQVCSPLSIHAAFTMLALGSAGETREQTFRVLGLGKDGNRGYSNYLETLTPGVGRFKVASKIWPSSKFKLLPTYLSHVRRDFKAKVQSLNFRNAGKARGIINDWVSEKTSQKIPELLPPNSVDGSTTLVLTNAVYFRGSWDSPFAEHSTRESTFHTPDGDVQVPMMSGAVKANYFEDEHFQVAGLPYAKSRLSFAVILPKDVKSPLESHRPKINAQLLFQVSGAANDGFEPPAKMMVTMPKFKLRQSSRPLAILKRMGLTSLLGPSPDLSKLSESGGLFVSECIHEAVVEVDEKGTVAAAATAVVVTRSSSPFTNRIWVNRPFFFAIFDTKTMVPVFLGQVTNPNQ